MILFLLLNIRFVVFSHSWLDCIGLASYNYTGNDQYFSDADFEHTCIGYPREYPGRMNKDINTIFTYAVLDRVESTNLCSNAQMSPNYNPEFPITKAAAGTKLKLWWELDNHKTPQTTLDIHWTGQPNTQLNTYGELNEENSLIAMDFANENNCMDINNVNSLCWGYMNVPYVEEKGLYSFVWIWHWNQNPAGEEYTTCFDILIE